MSITSILPIYNVVICISEFSKLQVLGSQFETLHQAVSKLTATTRHVPVAMITFVDDKINYRSS